MIHAGLLLNPAQREQSQRQILV